MQIPKIYTTIDVKEWIQDTVCVLSQQSENKYINFNKIEIGLILF